MRWRRYSTSQGPTYMTYNQNDFDKLFKDMESMALVLNQQVAMNDNNHSYIVIDANRSSTEKLKLFKPPMFVEDQIHWRWDGG